MIRFSPEQLIFSGCLVYENNVIYIDREALKEITTKDFDIKLSVTMHHCYGWDFKDYEASTIYFDFHNSVIIGGVYNTNTGKKTTKRIIADTRDPLIGDYIYSKTKTEGMITALDKVKKNESYTDKGCFFLACGVILQAMEDYTERGISEAKRAHILSFLRSDAPVIAMAHEYALKAAEMLEEDESRIKDNIEKYCK